VAANGAMRSARRRPEGRATLHEIARRAGVSATTVSNVVNGKFQMMAPETRAQIEQLIVEMNYRPSAAGRRLRLNRNHAIGLLVIDESPAFLADPFNTNIIAGLGNHLNRNGFSLIVNGVAPDRLEEAVLLGRHDTDALCVIPSGTPRQRREVLRALGKARQPLVVVQDGVPPWLADAASIRQDDEAGGRRIAERVLARGARRLVMLVPRRPWPAMARREAGVRAVLEGSSAELEVIATRSEEIEDCEAALAAFVAAHGMPDAVLGGNDQMAIAALLWLQADGHTVPADVLVTGFNGFEFRRYARPALTSIRSPALALGERAGALLIERVETGHFPVTEIVLPVELIEGESA
jgi:LacI family transcriptional regulator